MGDISPPGATFKKWSKISNGCWTLAGENEDPIILYYYFINNTQDHLKYATENKENLLLKLKLYW